MRRLLWTSLLLAALVHLALSETSRPTRQAGNFPLTMMRPPLPRFARPSFRQPPFLDQPFRQPPSFRQQPFNRQPLVNPVNVEGGFLPSNDVISHEFVRQNSDVFGSPIRQQVQAVSTPDASASSSQNFANIISQPSRSNSPHDNTLGRSNSLADITRDRSIKQETATGKNKARSTLKEILVEDCEDAEQLGYCASPPRYPTHQTALIMKKCAEIVEALYAPLPPEAASGHLRSSPRSAIFLSNKTSDMERANRQIWSWARYSRPQRDVSTSLCPATRHLIEPGYAREAATARWLVVLQSATDRVLQQVAVEECTVAGGQCDAATCAQTSTRCRQRYHYERLVAWDPDRPQQCPRIRVFKFPSACECTLADDLS